MTETVVRLPADATRRQIVAASDLLLGEMKRKGLPTWTLVLGDLPVPSTVRAAPFPAVVLLNVLAKNDSGAERSGSCGGLELGHGQEAFVICMPDADATVAVQARTDRGLMMGVGRLLREIEVSARGSASASVPRGLAVAVDPAPSAAMRGHQVTDWGFYMPEAVFEQHVKEQIVFGCNQIEFAHLVAESHDDNGVPRADGAKLVAFSRICDKYGLNVAIQAPPWPSAFTETAFAQMARVDQLFFEGGPLSQIQDGVAALRKTHPSATAWHSPSGMDAKTMAAWEAELALPATRAWLDGVVWGPIDLGGEMAMLDRISKISPQYKIRLYPDICHTLTAMYPVPDWHYAWAFTEGRQFPNPMPLHFSAVIRMNLNASFSQAGAVGFGAYSEGAADDPNKALWSALYLEPALSPEALVAQYTSYFFGAEGAALGADLVFGLEQSWVGDAASNAGVLSTLAVAQQLEAAVPAHLLAGSWRLQSLLFRCYFDAVVQARLRFEQGRERDAYAAISAAAAAPAGSGGGDPGPAAKALARPMDDPVAAGWRRRLPQLAANINASATLCGGCLSGGMMVLQSQTITLSLDTLDTPLADSDFLLAALANVTAVPMQPQQRPTAPGGSGTGSPGRTGTARAAAGSNGTGSAGAGSGGVHSGGPRSGEAHSEGDGLATRRAMLRALLAHTDPGPGGFYDALGDSPRSPRLPAGFGPVADAQYFFAPLIQVGDCRG
jgi:hypothetical protein